MSVDHTDGVIGKFFHFSLDSVNGFNSGDATIYLTATNSRTNAQVQVAFFSNANGGSVGDAHGRVHPSDQAQAGDWLVGDMLLIYDEYASYCPGE